MSPPKNTSSDNDFEAYLLKLYNNKSGVIKKRQINKTPAVIDEFEKKVRELVKVESNSKPNIFF